MMSEGTLHPGSGSEMEPDHRDQAGGTGQGTAKVEEWEEGPGPSRERWGQPPSPPPALHLEPPCAPCAENGRKQRPLRPLPWGSRRANWPIVGSNQLLTPYDCGDLNEPKLKRSTVFFFCGTNHISRAP